VKYRPVRRRGKTAWRRFRFWVSPTVVFPVQRQRHRKRWLKAIGYLCLGIASIYSLSIGHENLVYSSVFEVQRVETAGLNHLLEKDLKSLVGVNPSMRLFDVDLEKVKDRLLSHSWIKEVQIRKTFPDTLKIRVSERRPAAVIEEGDRRVLVDEAGEVLERQTSVDAGNIPFGKFSDERGVSLPVLRGIDIGALEKDDAEQYSVFQKVMDLVSIMRPESQAVHGTLRIDVHRGNEIVVEREGYHVWFGREGFQEKWERFLSVEADIHLRKKDFKEVDLRFPRQVVVR